MSENSPQLQQIQEKSAETPIGEAEHSLLEQMKMMQENGSSSHDVLATMAAEAADPEGPGKSKMKDKDIHEYAGGYTKQQLEALREKTATDYSKVVGKKGLVNSAHKDAQTYVEHRQAQELIMDSEQLKQLVEQGVVDPGAINAQMELVLGEKINADKIKINNIEKLQAVLGEELSGHTEKLTEEEKANVLRAVGEFAQTYQQAFEVPAQTVADFAVDVTRALAYQIARDKEVFSGSDHGDLHILKGVFDTGRGMIDSLKENGVPITDKEEVVFMLAAFYHDIGYTVGVAQAEMSFEASKDHPIFSTLYLDANKEYFTEKVGPEAFASLKEIVLLHSYRDPETTHQDVNEAGLHQQALNEVFALADGLGTTAETKCAAFFRKPEVIPELQKILFFVEKVKEKYPSDDQKNQRNQLIQDYVDHVKKDLIAIAEADERSASYKRAIETQFNHITVKLTLGQFAGVLESASYETQPDSDGNTKLVPKIEMKISHVQAVLANIFGEDYSLRAFVKAMADLGISQQQIEDIGLKIQQYHETQDPNLRAEIQQDLQVVTQEAKFVFDTEFPEDMDKYRESFIHLERLSLKNELRETVDSIDTDDRVNLLDLSTKMGAYLTEDLKSSELFVTFSGTINKILTQNEEKVQLEKEDLKKMVDSLIELQERSFLGVNEEMKVPVAVI